MAAASSQCGSRKPRVCGPSPPAAHGAPSTDQLSPRNWWRCPQPPAEPTAGTWSHVKQKKIGGGGIFSCIFPEPIHLPAWGGSLAARPTAKAGGRATFPRQKASSALPFSLAPPRWLQVIFVPIPSPRAITEPSHPSDHSHEALMWGGQCRSLTDDNWCWARSGFMSRSTSDFSPGSRKAPSPKCSLEGLDAHFILPFPKWQLLHLQQFISWLQHPAVVLQGIHILQCVSAPEAARCHRCRASPRQLWVHKQTTPRPKGMLSIPTNSHSSAHTISSSFPPARKRSANADQASSRDTWAKKQQHRPSPVRDVWYQGRRSEGSESVKVGRFRPDQSSEHCFHALCCGSAWEALSTLQLKPSAGDGAAAASPAPRARPAALFWLVFPLALGA